MADITLNVQSARDTRAVAMTSDHLVIGCADDEGDSAHANGKLLIADTGLAARHASINRAGERVWILDEGSPAGTFVNQRRVPPQGLPLADGDEIFAGEHTTIIMHLRTGAAHDERTPSTARAAWAARLPRALAVVVPALCLVVLVALGGQLLGKRSARQPNVAAPPIAQQTAPPVPDVEPLPAADATPAWPAQPDGADVSPPSQPPSSARLYLQMSQAEQLEFIERQAQHVSTLMGNRPYAFNDDVLGYIKQYVDVYARRVGNNSQRLWGEDLRFTFARARTQYAPYIIRAFNARNVPPVVGLYLVMIETEYHNIGGENAAGAAGLFQFIGPTARAYGVDPAERTNVEKMAPAAARYMGDRIAEFGPDAMSVALAIAGYNRSPDSVRRDLRDVLDSQNKERSFWTLVANSSKLDHYFQHENVKYVPKFFAAAIVGENPEAFGLDMRQLSTYTTLPASAPTQTAQATSAPTAVDIR